MLRATRPSKIAEYQFGQQPFTRFFGYMGQRQLPPKHEEVKTTTLPNGTRIVSHDRFSNHSAIGVYVEAGPKFDPLSAPGLSYVMRFALQSSNMNNSLFQIDRTMRAYGVAYGHNEVRKRYIGFKAELRRDVWQVPFEHLVTGIVAPKFHEPDVERFRDTFDNELEEMRWQRPHEYAVQQLETVAFFKEPLGNPRHVPPTANDKITHDVLLKQWCSRCVPSAVTISAVNIPHDEIVAAYHRLPYQHSASAPHHAKSETVLLSHDSEGTQFCPGKQMVVHEDRAKEMGTAPDQEPEVVVAIGWPAHGFDTDVKQYAASLVAREIYAISIHEGPQYAHAHSALGRRSFYRPYSTCGLLGFTVVSRPEDARRDVTELVRSLPRAVSDEILSAAQTRALVRFNAEEVEMVRDYVDFLGTSKHSEQQVIDAIKAVSNNELTQVLRMRAGVAPAMFVTGQTHDFQNMQQLGIA